MIEKWGLRKAHFDQCMLGCPAKLAVDVATTSTELCNSSVVCSEDHKHLSTRGVARRESRTIRKRKPPSSFSGGLAFELARSINRDLKPEVGAATNELGDPGDLIRFPPLPRELVEDAEWRTLWAAEWSREEPIQRLEGRASLGAPRWAARRPDTYRRRVLLQCDNLSFVHSANK